MLKTLRKNTKTVIWIVVVAFCLWGGFAFSVQLQKQNRMAGEVFGKAISFQEFNLFYKASQMFSFSGKPLEDPTQIAQHAWQTLIYSREAKRQKIQVTDDEVRQEILRLLSAQKIENPTPEFYKRWLQAAFGLKPNEFEKQIREILRIQKLLVKINEAPASVTDKEVENRFYEEENKLSLSLVLVPDKEHAQSFFEKIKKHPKEWDSEIKAGKYEVKPTGEASLEVLVHGWGIPQEKAAVFLSKEAETVLGPLNLSGKDTVVKILGKKLADPKKFTDEVKKKYKDQLSVRKKYERFFLWNNDLIQHANLKDFTPRPEPVPSSAPQETKIRKESAAPKPTSTSPSSSSQTHQNTKK